MLLPTDAEVMQMDGPALTRLAYDLGLAGPGVVIWCGAPFLVYEDVYWEPHRCLEQAHALFWGLGSRGWMLSQSWEPHMPTPDECGCITAVKGRVYHGVHYTPVTEALGLLRCACLVGLTEQQEKP